VASFVPEVEIVAVSPLTHRMLTRALALIVHKATALSVAPWIRRVGGLLEVTWFTGE